uniref:Uncharacterized protein n=1 Tax=Arundo donax TaxID=35708 RepID=A0A0A9FSD2_ARUDO
MSLSEYTLLSVNKFVMYLILVDLCCDIYPDLPVPSVCNDVKPSCGALSLSAWRDCKKFGIS